LSTIPREVSAGRRFCAASDPFTEKVWTTVARATVEVPRRTPRSGASVDRAGEGRRVTVVPWRLTDLTFVRVGRDGRETVDRTVRSTRPQMLPAALRLPIRSTA